MRYLIPCCLTAILTVAACGETTSEPGPAKETKPEKKMEEKPAPVVAAGQSYSLEIEGMVCMNCSAHVTKALEGMDGVLSAEVDHQTGRAKVTMKKGASLDEAKARDLLDIDDYKLKACAEIQ